MKIKAYTEGLGMKQFKHIPSISVYNQNYYNGFHKDLLFASSDDDDTTEWFLVEYTEFKHLGNSYVSEGDILNLKFK